MDNNKPIKTLEFINTGPQITTDESILIREIEEKTEFEKLTDWWQNNGTFNVELYKNLCRIRRA